MDASFSPDFSISWVERTADAIEVSANFGQALRVSAANLSDLLDTLIPIVEPGSMLEGRYTSFLELKIKEWKVWGPPVTQEAIDHVNFLEIARDIFHLYEMSPGMAEWELEFEANQLFTPGFEQEVEEEDAIRLIFVQTCSYFQAWLESEIKYPMQRFLTQLTFETWAFYGITPFPEGWHLYPKEAPIPDGMEEFKRVGWE